jgi:uncharacterized membrane protein
MEPEKAEKLEGIRVERTVIIDRPQEELYRFWRNFENLPCVMHHLETVKVLDAKRSHWVAKGPVGTHFEWTSEVVEDIENQRISWRSIEGSQVDSEGTVYFRRATGGRGTEVKVLLRYDPPGGKVGATFAKFFGEEPSQEIREGLRHFKQFMETGEIPTNKGQPRGK